jgi:hypothetical protein
MPAISKKQYRLMRAAAQGDVKLPGLSKEKAAEFVKGQSPIGLPEQAAKKGLKRLVKHTKSTKRKRFRIG